jgi:hypothetical protein
LTFAFKNDNGLISPTPLLTRQSAFFTADEIAEQTLVAVKSAASTSSRAPSSPISSFRSARRVINWVGMVALSARSHRLHSLSVLETPHPLALSTKRRRTGRNITGTTISTSIVSPAASPRPGPLVDHLGAHGED